MYQKSVATLPTIFKCCHKAFSNSFALLTVAIIPLFCPSPLIDLIGLDEMIIDDDWDENIATHKEAPRTRALKDLCQAFDLL